MLDHQATAIERALDGISEALYCSARLFDDGIIDPRDTRAVLLLALETCLAGIRTEPHANSFGVARL
jgi:geranyl-CoA carboxylase beta subunit